jgi:hypothetical protein
VRIAAGRHASGGGRDAQPVGTFFDRRAELAQLGGHRGEAIRLLHAPARYVRQRRRPVGIERHRRQRHRRVGDVVAVERDRAQRPRAALDLQRVGLGADLGAHRARGFDKADVALDRVVADAFDAQRPAARADRAQRDEVRRRRGIAFDMHVARRAVAAPGRHDEALPAVALHRDAEARQQRQRDLDIGLGDQLAFDLDRDRA